MVNGHGAELTIDLGALADNWRLLAARAGRAECGAVVKADAYGCGIGETGPALAAAGCRTFFVAHLSEGARLRAAVPEGTIYVLNGLPPGSGHLYVEHRLRPVLGSVAEVNEWSLSGKGEPCALHVDTGMNRLGVALHELAFVGGETELRNMGVSLVMTHFTASEDAADPMTTEQAERFAAIAARYRDIPKSLFNSSAHFRDGLPSYDLTRPGYALYGGNPVPGAPNPMKPVVGLKARIVQIREVRDGEAVGYNGRWHAKGRRRLATISLGYADGYPRNAGGLDDAPGGKALIGGAACPFVGTVSMDLIIVDATDAPAEAARRGGEAVLIGGELDLETVGLGAKTIGYEMLTSLGRRHQRRYLGG